MKIIILPISVLNIKVSTKFKTRSKARHSNGAYYLSLGGIQNVRNGSQRWRRHPHCIAKWELLRPHTFLTDYIKGGIRLLSCVYFNSYFSYWLCGKNWRKMASKIYYLAYYYDLLTADESKRFSTGILDWTHLHTQATGVTWTRLAADRDQGTRWRKPTPRDEVSNKQFLYIYNLKY